MFTIVEETRLQKSNVKEVSKLKYKSFTSSSSFSSFSSSSSSSSSFVILRYALYLYVFHKQNLTLHMTKEGNPFFI